jgi:hypothetical protein
LEPNNIDTAWLSPSCQLDKKKIVPNVCYLCPGQVQFVLFRSQLDKIAIRGCTPMRYQQIKNDLML